jgi:hypothetical protein
VKFVITSLRALDVSRGPPKALVAVAIAAGQPVHRSPSAQPAAVLGVRGRGEGLARRLINEDAARILPVFCLLFTQVRHARADARHGSCWVC